MALSAPIDTERLQIMPFSEQYLTKEYVNWLNDPEIVRYSDQRFKVHTRETCKHFYESFQNSPHHFWAIVSKEYGYIGTMTAYIDTNHSVADVGILIGKKDCWGRGFGFEAWTAICHYLIRELKIRKITAGTLSVNKGMLSIMQRAGMIEDGKRIRQCLYENQEVDLVYVALFPDHLG